MFRTTLALALASVTSIATAATANLSTLDSTSPWWERVTVTIAGDGQPKSCRFESSNGPQTAKDCQVEASEAAVAKTSTGSKESYTRLIGARGTVEGCQIVAASGEMKPDYGCKEASAEKFQASASTAHAAPRQAYMTILVYGHQEHVV